MGGLKDSFYRKIGNDYYDRSEESFIYRYVKNEKELNLRLRIKRAYRQLEDTAESKGRYVRLLCEGIVSDKQLVDKIGGMKTYNDLICAVYDGLGTNADDRAWDVYADGSRVQLMYIADALRRRSVLDVDLDILDEFTEELLGDYEFDGERRNPYVQLTSGYIDYQSGDISAADFIVIIMELVTSYSRYSLNRNEMNRLQILGESAWGSDVFDGIRRAGDKLKLMIEMAYRDIDSLNKCICEKIDAGFIENMTERLQGEIIRVDVNTLLYDSGFSIDDRTLRDARKKDKGMDLIDAYFDDVGIDPFNDGTNRIDQGDLYENRTAYFAECERLRDSLNHDRGDSRYQGVFIPMWVDRESGGGVFLVGRSNFKFAPMVKLRNNCGFGIVDFINIDDETGMTYGLLDDELYMDFPNMDEAVSWYDAYKESSIMEAYQTYNNEIPENCPDIFVKYFKSKRNDIEMINEDAQIQQKLQEFQCEQREVQIRETEKREVLRKEYRRNYE